MQKPTSGPDVTAHYGRLVRLNGLTLTREEARAVLLLIAKLSKRPPRGGFSVAETAALRSALALIVHELNLKGVTT
jgi:hypothetical protein